MSEENTEEKHPTAEEIKKLWNDDYVNNIRFPDTKPRRVVDQYGKEEIGAHVQRFAQHCAAKGIKPTFDVILDWLYGEKAFDERDDFVSIQKLMELVGNGQVYPLLIMEVLAYALKVENAAIEVHDELGHLSGNFKSLENLNKALEIRLEKKEENVELKGDDGNPIGKLGQFFGG